MKTTPRSSVGRLRLYYGALAILLGALLVGCGPQQKYAGKKAKQNIDAESWKTIDEPTLGFKAKFPGQWKTSTDTMMTDRGVAQVYIFDYWHVAFQYGITVVRFPPGVSDMSDPDQVLDYAVESLAQKQNGTLSYQEDINIGGYPARRAMLTLPDSYLKQSRVNTLIVLRNQYVYRITTAGVGNHEYVEHFIDSFELTPVQMQFDN